MTSAPPSRTNSNGVVPYLRRLNLSGDIPRRPVLRSAEGALITVPLPGEHGGVEYRGVWVGHTAAEFVGLPVPVHGLSQQYHLENAAGPLADLFVEASQVYLERTEELDTQLAALEKRGPQVPVAEVWNLERRAATLREQEGRALAALAELGRMPADAPLKLGRAVPALESELERVAELTRSVQQGLAALILLWNTEHGNRLAETANELGTISNRIAELQNISNIRMLGITFIVLALALVAAAISIPNTAATILGMPSAGWVPGLWVDVILIVLAVLPLVIIFSRPWVRAFLREFSRYEFRTAEGIHDLPERLPTSPPAPGRGGGPN